MHRLFKEFEVPKGERAFKVELWPWWNIHLIFHVSLLEPHRVSARVGRKQSLLVPEDIEEGLVFEVEKIMECEIISYTRKVGRRNKEFNEVRYFIKWKDCAKDKNTRELPEGL